MQLCTAGLCKVVSGLHTCAKPLTLNVQALRRHYSSHCTEHPVDTAVEDLLAMLHRKPPETQAQVDKDGCAQAIPPAEKLMARHAMTWLPGTVIEILACA